MKKYDHLRVKAVEFRKKGMSLPDICDRLKMSKGTVYHWIRDFPGIEVTEKQRNSARAASEFNKKKWEKIRKKWYEEAMKEAEEKFLDPFFRDCITLYLTEGFRRTRHTVSFSNSNPNMVKFFHDYFLIPLSEKKTTYSLQCHIDNDEDELKSFWARLLGIKPKEIQVIRKSNAGNLVGRNWRSVHGVLTVRSNSTELRTKLQAWMDYLQEIWVQQGVAQSG